MEHITEMTIGKTVFVICAEHSPTATETVEQKIKKLVLQHALDNRKVIGNSTINAAESLEMCKNPRPNGK